MSQQNEAVIQQLACTILSLTPKYAPSGWVPWSSVSQHMYGTAQMIPLLIGYTALPQFSGLFNANNRVVKLTQAGAVFARGCSQQPEPRLADVQAIARAIQAYAGALAPLHFRVENIRWIAAVENRHVHAIEVYPSDEVLPSETPVTFRSEGSAGIFGKIVGQEPDGGILYVSLSNHIFPAQLPGQLIIERGKLLFDLSARIASLTNTPPLMRALLHYDTANNVLIATPDSLSAVDQLLDLPTPWARFLWGPPGSGKTYALGHFIDRLMQVETTSKILVVAPSNRAVDVAVEQLLKHVGPEAVSARRILRYGYPRLASIVDRPELLGPVGLDALNAKVRELSGRLNKGERGQLADVEIAMLRAKLLSAQEEVKNAVAEHVQRCQIVATTAALAVTDLIAQIRWNTVIVDEVTMVTPAMCLFLASLADHRLVLAGDPRQLGPVYEQTGNVPAESFEWMGRDIFDKSGVSSGTGERRLIAETDARLVRITGQHRCAREIWSTVAQLYPQVDSFVKEQDRHQTIDLSPCPGSSIVVLDTSNSGGLCEKRHGSWRNAFSAELAMEVAGAIAAEAEPGTSIAIISPYRAQVQLLRNSIRAERRAENTPYRSVSVESGTVHQFQGSDADVVIFDLVDGQGRSNLGNLLQGDTGLRLVNVAITRARAKFILIADKNWCASRITSTINPLLSALIKGEAYVRTLPVAPSETGPSSVFESPIEQQLYEALVLHPELQHVTPQYVIRDETGQPVSRADFAFPEINYAVYCDGRQWHLREDRWQRDLRQRNKLTEIGWVFSVFSGRDVKADVRGCALVVKETFARRKT